MAIQIYLAIPLALLGTNLATAFELIAHRGVHQTYHRRNLDNFTCSATRIDKTDHDYLENTIRSMKKAFELGATMVELDIHPTREPDGSHKMVVFHDWNLDCRTEAKCSNGCQCNNKDQCLTHEQSLEYLKSLDIGYGYTYDEGKSYPFRGRYVGQMPTLEEVLDLLLEYNDKKFLVNLKDTFQVTVDLFMEIVAHYPETVRNRIYFPYNERNAADLKAMGIQESIYQGGEPARECFTKYIFAGIVGYFPKACRNTKLFVPVRETLGRLHPWLEGIQGIDLLWGWPEDFVRLAHRHKTEIYASQVDSIQEYEVLKNSGLNGMMTNKIEIIAPFAPNPTAK